MAEVIDRYQALADDFGRRVDATADDGWDAAAPCEDWTARDIVAHVAGAQRRMTAGVEGTEAEPIAEDADPKEVWRSSYAALREALQKPGALEHNVESPMGPMTLEVVLGRLASMDVLVHTWDLARATGGDEQLDADAVGHAFEGIRPMDAMIRRPGVFGPKIEPPAGADVQTQFLCFLGRQP